MTGIQCSSCGVDLAADDAACAQCGSGDRSITVTDSAKVYVGFRGQARHGQPGDIKPHSVQSSEIKWNHDRQRNECRNMVVDRENDYYLQEWHDLDTDEVTFHKEGKLSHDEKHGKSARRGKQADES